MINLIINNTKINVPNNTTILQACNYLNINIPKFCFHENLQIAGNCRMCLVEVKNSPKPVVSCTTPVMENMVVFTNSALVHKARESVLEFLLINHPLDCPICDQGGECDLQDETMAYGSDRSRFFFSKRSVEDKNCGPFIKTIMTRCIHCTRCVRFAQEICGIDNLGMVGRGTHSEISFYLKNIFHSEFSANVIDLCPVGALTSKQYAFKNRPWELDDKISVDLLDSLGTKIIIQTVNNNIIRILPRINKLLNIEWISNKTRFFFDSINYQRIKQPMVKKNEIFKSISWEEAFILLKKKMKNIDCSQKNFYSGNFLSLEESLIFKYFANLNGNNLQYPFQKLISNADLVSDNCNSIDFIEKLSQSNLCILINCNPRLDCSLLNLKLKLLNQQNNLKIFSIGPCLNLTYPVQNLGISSNILINLATGKHTLCQKIVKSVNTTLIFGENVNSTLKKNLINSFDSNCNINFMTLFTKPGSLNFLETSGTFSSKKLLKSKLNFFYNTDLEISKFLMLQKNSFSIFIGHHFNKNAQFSNLILPTTTFLEKKGQYLNLTGQIQQTQRVLKSNLNIKNDLVLFKNLIQFLNNVKLTDSKNFNKLFIAYLSNKQLQICKLNIKNKKTNTTFKNQIFKQSNDIFFPKTVFEKNSKTLINSLTQLQKTANFLL